MSTIQQYQVCDADISAFERDGAVALRNIVDESWLERLRTAIDHNLESDDWYFHYIYMWQRDPELYDFCFNSPLGEAAAQLLSTSKVNLIYDQIFVKDELRVDRTEWHNDQPYWPVRGPTASIWLSIDETTKTTGAMEFIRGSHRWDRWFEIVGPYDPPEVNPKFEKIPDYESERDAHEILTWDLAPGDAVAFHGLAVHASYPFVQPIRRRAYSLRFAAQEAIYAEESGALPRFCNPELREGQGLDSEKYPAVFSRTDA